MLEDLKGEKIPCFVDVRTSNFLTPFLQGVKMNNIFDKYFKHAGILLKSKKMKSCVNCLELC